MTEQEPRIEQIDLLPTVVAPHHPKERASELEWSAWCQGILDNIRSVALPSITTSRSLDDSGISSQNAGTRRPSESLSIGPESSMLVASHLRDSGLDLNHPLDFSPIHPPKSSSVSGSSRATPEQMHAKPPVPSRDSGLSVGFNSNNSTPGKPNKRTTDLDVFLAQLEEAPEAPSAVEALGADSSDQQDDMYRDDAELCSLAADSPTWLQQLSKQIAEQAVQQRLNRTTSLTDLHAESTAHDESLYARQCPALHGSTADLSSLTRLESMLKEQDYAEDASEFVTNLNDTTDPQDVQETQQAWSTKVSRVLQKSGARLVDLFNVLDRDSDGYLTREDLLVGCIRMDLMVTMPECDALFELCDRDRDSRLDYAEFAAAWKEGGNGSKQRSQSMRKSIATALLTPQRPKPPVPRRVSTPVLAHLGPENPLTPNVLSEVCRTLKHVVCLPELVCIT